MPVRRSSCRSFLPRSAAAFAAMCYAEFATTIPLSGSSCSYAYATLGELVAWFIGWNMMLQYGVLASAVAVSWAGYFTSLVDHFGMHLPAQLTNAARVHRQPSGRDRRTVQPAGGDDRAAVDVAVLRRHSRIEHGEYLDGDIEGGADRHRHHRGLAIPEPESLAPVHSRAAGTGQVGLGRRAAHRRP